MLKIFLLSCLLLLIYVPLSYGDNSSRLDELDSACQKGQCSVLML